MKMIILLLIKNMYKLYYIKFIMDFQARKRNKEISSFIGPNPTKKQKIEDLQPNNLAISMKHTPQHQIQQLRKNELAIFQYKLQHRSQQQKQQSIIKPISQTTNDHNYGFLINNPSLGTRCDVKDNEFLDERKQQRHKIVDLNSGSIIRIADPPSHKKNNIVVTRGVDFVPVDNYFTRRNQAKVYEFNKAFYSITLSQSNLAKDDNKFFIIQLLQVGVSLQYYLFSRWGRVGVMGQISQNGPLERKEAIRLYNAKSQGKVKNGGYRIVEMSYDHDQQLQERSSQEIGQYLTKDKDNSNLSEKVQDLIRLIFDIKMMQNNMRELGYDQKRSPLGLIAQSAIQKGYIQLGNILKVLKSEEPQSQKRKLYNQYSSQFYSAIPHDFGYLNMRAFVLNSEEKIKQKQEMLASLSQIQIYFNLMSQKIINDRLPDVDIKYSKLKCKISPLAKDTPIYAALRRYLNNTHAKTHSQYCIELVEIFTLSRPQQNERFMENIGNKMLLWHGSRLANYVGILSEGLKIAPYEAPHTGYMFGKGIYFADVFSKSANYCKPKHNSTGLLLLCEVALGEMNDKFAADYTARNLPPGKHSTRGVGKQSPSSGEVINGVFIPNGQLKSSGVEQTSLNYNEYVVYDREQIQCKYIVQVNFIFKK